MTLDLFLGVMTIMSVIIVVFMVDLSFNLRRLIKRIDKLPKP